LFRRKFIKKITDYNRPYPIMTELIHKSCIIKESSGTKNLKKNEAIETRKISCTLKRNKYMHKT
ncbi:hypothetical protein L9F63_024486, partial [Diploptera punctata]